MCGSQIVLELPMSMWMRYCCKKIHCKEEGGMWGGHELNPGHFADKQRHRPPQGPITPYRTC